VQVLIIVFDVDGVLCESKNKIDEEMGALLEELSLRNTIVFLTGGKLEQVATQVLPFSNMKKPYYILPTSGADAWIVGEANSMLWNNHFSPEQKGRIVAGIIHVFNKMPRPSFMWGSMVEDRLSQITISLLGQDAPWFIKKYYDPQEKIRRALVFNLKETIINSDDFDFTIGGSTSIDITKKGVNKGSMLKNLVEFNNWNINDIWFVGDQLHKDGNDYTVKEEGFHTIQVENVNETKNLIKKWLTNEET
jgi:HAD superfamily hydrolase (TIGR01484 family)